MMSYWVTVWEEIGDGRRVEGVMIALGFDTLPSLAGGVTIGKRTDHDGLAFFRRDSTYVEPEIFVDGISYGRGSGSGWRKTNVNSYYESCSSEPEVEIMKFGELKPEPEFLFGNLGEPKYAR